jgi:hypothetical protein
VRGFEPKRSDVLVGRIYPLVDIETGFLILNLKNEDYFIWSVGLPHTFSTKAIFYGRVNFYFSYFLA